MQYLSFCVYLFSLSIMSSRFIHVVANDRISPFLIAEKYCNVCIHIFFIHSPVHIHLGCFHVLIIVNHAAMNWGVNKLLLLLLLLLALFCAWSTECMERCRKPKTSQTEEKRRILEGKQVQTNHHSEVSDKPWRP